MKKRLLCAALALILLLGLLPAQALADDPQTITGKMDDSISWSFAPVEGVLTVSGTGAIPNCSYSEGAPWYLYRSRIFRVVLEKGITGIGSYAFNECPVLTEVDASKAAITEIGEGAFSNCVLLESFSFVPSEELSVGDDAFSGCIALKAVDLGAKYGTLGAGVFSGCTALKEVALPKEVPALERDAFSGCKALEKINVPAGLETIGKNCFRDCAALPNLTFPDSLMAVDRYAFCGCKGRTMTFRGDLPDFAPASDVSSSFEQDTILRFPYNTESWTWPVCKGYETKIVYPSLDSVFKDLKKGAWYIPSVQHVYYTGLMNGMSDGVFAPDGLVSRGQLVTVLYRFANTPKTDAKIPFTDVAAKSYYYDAVRWAHANGIVNGVAATRFAPEDKISRQQLCAILYRYAATLELDLARRDPLTDFSDADKVASYAKDAMSWCVAMGLINGKSSTLLDPAGNATRAEIAKVLTSFDAFVRREELTAPERWEDDILIPDVVPDIDREDPLYLYAREVFDAINVERTEAGLKAYVWNDHLYLAARTRAKEISGENCFTHTRPDGTSYSTVLAEFEVNATIRNEIIAHGYTTAQSLVDKWATANTTSPVISALVYSQAAVGVFKTEPGKDETEGKYYYALLVIG